MTSDWKLYLYREELSMHYRFSVEAGWLLGSLSVAAVFTGRVLMGMLEALPLKLLQETLALVGNEWFQHLPQKNPTFFHLSCPWAAV